jgi:signal transduction histidine kinase
MKNHSPDGRHSSYLRWAGAIRPRAALASVLIVGTAFAISFVSITSLLHNSLYESARNTAEAEALALSSLVEAQGSLHGTLPISTPEMAAQVLDSSGGVERSSANISGQPAMADLNPVSGHFSVASGVVLKVRRFTHIRLDLDNRFVVVANRLYGVTGPGTVLVAFSLGSADHAVGLVRLALSITLPVLALLVGAVVWALTGWALRPVEAIRSEVAVVSATDLRRRVPEPASDDEVGRLAHTMNDMLARIEAGHNRQRQLVADVSHELRNPLASLKAQLEVAAAHPGPATANMVEGSVVEVNRMSQLVEDLLTLARLDDGMLPLRLTDVDIDELVISEADRLRSTGRVDVSVKGVGAARVRGDEAQLSRVVANLAQNAGRHARTRVEFTATTNGGYCYLYVADDGPGVPWFERQRIFERFVRLDSARHHEGTGAGLGLAIVREIVQGHSGEVWVEDAQPGARFIVRLPLAYQTVTGAGTAPPLMGRRTAGALSVPVA